MKNCGVHMKFSFWLNRKAKKMNKKRTTYYTIHGRKYYQEDKITSLPNLETIRNSMHITIYHIWYNLQINYNYAYITK
jgi:hypothetical protein